MRNHRRFTDLSGYTRHCWECEHANGWRKGSFSWVYVAKCELTGRMVEAYDSPDNQNTYLPIGCNYDEGRAE